MTDALFSTSWYRVAELKPRLRGHVQIHRHQYRGELWYVLQDHLSGKFQRFTPTAHQAIALMDGKRTVQEIWDIACARLEADTLTQDEMIRLLTQLHAIDALQSDVVPDTRETIKRLKKQQFGKLKQNLKSPLFMRIPLLDPERILNRFNVLIRPFFSLPGFLVWLVVVGTGIFFAGIHWSELTLNITDRILSPTNLVVMWLTFPFLKAFHEFAHGFAVNVKGGEVHEMGIMMLVFTPIPYVDASSSSSFRAKWDRIVVGAAGLLVEMFIAAVALFAWINMEPGPARSVTYNIIFIAGVSSLFFNGNPLLRYDAYYVLSDFLEIPNLGTRGIQYTLYLFQRYILGIRKVEPPITGPGERFWFVVYTVCAFIYRMFVYVAIILFIAGKFFFIGVVMACWGAFNMFILPLFKGLKFMMTSPRVSNSRAGAMAVSTFFVVLLVLLITMVPVPLSTITEGVIWVPEKSFVRAGADGFIEKIAATPGDIIKNGDMLIQCADPFLPAQIRLLEAEKREMEAVYNTQVISDRVKAEITKKEIQHITARLEDARNREKDLTIISHTDGVLLLPMAQDLPASFVHRGQLLGYVMDRSALTVRVVIAQADVDDVRRRTRKVTVRLPENLSTPIPATLKREVPAATDELPGLVLAREGGGKIAINPENPHGKRAFQKFFLFDIELPSQSQFYRVGSRVHVRFSHGNEPLFRRWYKGIRQLFLKKFNI
nr:peptidase M50 [uncultured Desulfobacter sp.]